jgi:hypothetical protein
LFLPIVRVGVVAVFILRFQSAEYKRHVIAARRSRRILFNCILYAVGTRTREKKKKKEERAKSAREGVCGILSKYLPFSANNLSRDE